MKTEKRFTTTEIVVYRLSYSTKVVSFDTIQEAITHVSNQHEKHPRSKKFNAYIKDSQEKISKHYYDWMNDLKN